MLTEVSTMASIDVVWTDYQQARLIDSLIKNIPIPPIIICVIHNESEKTARRICIDGKQRLTAIRRFMDGDLAYEDQKTGKQIHYDKGEARTRKEMTDVEKVDFQCQPISCIEYDDLTKDQQREIFLRTNQHQ
ncbi:hypothetical protein AAF712_009331 [Marasmius tenuissimus]|uniref:GmrSD restriction endonucleases N-terminal domain-containing protein n=1 Tax=Marasmius tenuissimus TaxID=585030 RepID=A0ABR2ZSE5_9AGAR